MPKTSNSKETKTKNSRRRRPELFRLASLAHGLARDRRTLLDHYLRPFGVTRAQGVLLGTLAQSGNEGIMQIDLARSLEVGKVSVGGLIDRLESNGYVERRSDHQDRRVKRVYITDQGYELLERAMDVTEHWNKLVVEGVEPAELRAAEDVLDRVRKNMRFLVDARVRNHSGDHQE